ncbi:S9 family peptidase, partial [[Mycoplasma] testudinis]|uniref:S9 family peptidase n=1 Tax=[Mycoplasma] testudinis TaxID=33924 RepID=UPI00055A0E3D
MEKITIKEFFETPNYWEYDLSPNGAKLSYLKKIASRSNIFVKDLKTNKEIQLTSFKDRSVDGYGWIDNKTLWFLKDIGGDENHHLYIVDLTTKKHEDVTPWKGVKVAGVSALIHQVFFEKKAKYKNLIRVSHNKRNKTFFDDYWYNIKTKQWTMHIQNDENIVDTLEDENFNLKYRTITGAGKSFVQKLNKDAKFETIKTFDSQDNFELLHLYPDGSVLTANNINRDKICLIKYHDVNLSDQKAELVFEDNLVDVYRASLDEQDHYKLKAIILNKEYWEFKFLDKKTKEFYASIQKLACAKYPDLKGSLFLTVAKSVDRNYYVFQTLSDNSNSQYLLYDKLKNNIEILNPEPSKLNAKNLVKMKPISFTARDGLKISGYLTLPKNARGPVPLIVNVHGGPWHRDSWGYNPEVQFLANRGYGVLQINFRSSTGFGKKFFVAGWHQWGLAMQDDITDGTLWAIKNKYTSKDKVAIYGGSYGGYATLMGIIKEPDLYKAAVDYCGVSDLFTLYDSMPQYWKTPGNIFDEALGNPHNNQAYAKKASPIFHVKKIKTPLFVVHGANDPRCTLEQANKIVDALKTKKVPVKLLVKDNEGHGFHNEENRFELYEEMEKFFNEYLKK